MPEDYRIDPGWEGKPISPVRQRLAGWWAFVIGLFRPTLRGLTPREQRYKAEADRVARKASRAVADLSERMTAEALTVQRERMAEQARHREELQRHREQIASLETQLRASEVDRRKLESEVAVQRAELELMAGVLQRERARIEAETTGYAARTALHTVSRQPD